MDDNFLEDHEHFNNENKLHIPSLERENLKDYINKDKKDQNYGYSEVAPTEQDETKFALLNAMGIYKTADDLPSGVNPDTTSNLPKELPVQFKELKTAPIVEGYNEPDTIPIASGKVSEGITKFEKTRNEIETLKGELEKKVKPLKDSIKEISKPFEDEIKAKEALKVSYLDMIYDQLWKTAERIAAWEKFIFASYQRAKLTIPNVTLAQVIDRAGTIDSKIQNEILKIKAILENEATGEVVERTVYKHPISEVQRKKISGKISADLVDDSDRALVDIINNLEAINAEFSKFLNDIE